MSTDQVTWDLRDRVAIITLNRPEQHNARNDELEAGFLEALTRADEDVEVRAVVLTGAGRSFCVGAEMSTVSSFAAASEAITSIPYPLATYAMAVRKPVIAAINGATAGLGLIYALTCDVRYVAAGAKLTTSFARRGLVAERTLAWLLPRVVGYGAAMDIALSGRVVLAEEALQLGLVNKVLPPEDVLSAAFEWARDVADHCSPGAVEMIKSQLRRSMTQDVLASLQEANALAVHAFQRSDAGEGAASFIAGRDPSFTPVGGPRDALDIAIAGPASDTSITS